ncbi:MAG: DUF86 domain-containing protein [Planctomycetota bacterium]
MVNRNVLSGKIAFIQRSLDRLNQRKGVKLALLQENLDIHDIVMHNLQLAIQGCIDIANHIISDNSWEVPGTQAEAFRVLNQHKVITPKTSEFMRRMVGLRNIIIHEYQRVDMAIVHKILTKELNSLNRYLKEIIKFSGL